MWPYHECVVDVSEPFSGFVLSCVQCHFFKMFHEYITDPLFAGKICSSSRIGEFKEKVTSALILELYGRTLAQNGNLVLQGDARSLCVRLSHKLERAISL
jgi:hypothetical protein